MKKIDKPVYTTDFSFDLCVSKVGSSKIEILMKKIRPEILRISKQYEELAAEQKLSLLNDNTCENLNVDPEDLKKLYTYRMRDKTQPGRDIYDKMIIAVPQCPSCGQITTNTIDHYLPQFKFPSLVIAPINLIPACERCNTKKLTAIGTNFEEETLHPYFDDFLNKRFLFAKVIESTPPVIDFSIDSPSDWKDEVSKKVKKHFTFFELNKLYSIHSAGEISGYADEWSDLPAEDLKQLFRKRAKSWSEKYPNSWKVALYDALADSNWFCNGGYLKFPSI